MCELEADIAKADNGAQGSARQFKEEYIMVVQHNLTAMNSNRMLGLTTATQAKSTEKLSSGYKINRAADDAAGLSLALTKLYNPFLYIKNSKKRTLFHKVQLY